MFFCFYSFSTLENSGLLFYNGRFNEKHDFITLEIQDGQVVLKYSTGMSCLSLIIHCCLQESPFKGQGDSLLLCVVALIACLFASVWLCADHKINSLQPVVVCVCRRVVHAGEPLCAWRGERWQLAHGPHPLLQQGGLQSSSDHCFPFLLSHSTFCFFWLDKSANSYLLIMYVF